MTLSRRHVLACTAALCACAPSARAATWPAALKPPAVKPALTSLDRAQVQLTESPLLDQFTWQRDLFLALDDDKLLKPFRSRAGQAAPGGDMGGWYDDSRDFFVDPNDWSTLNWHGYIPGHSFGQYVSGLSRQYAATGDATIKAKVQGLIDGYAPTVGPSFFDGYYLPAYTYDKLVTGLIDAYRYAGVASAPAVLDRVTDAVLPYLPEKALTREERRQRPYTSEAQIWDEPYTLPENLFLAWRLGLGERYLGLALRYLQDGPLFDPLAHNESPFKGKHAYSHVNALSSAVQAYEVTGDPKYLAAARNGFAFLQAQSFATGGWGPNEELLAPGDDDTLYRMLSETHRSFETPCGAYGHAKLTRSLLGLTGDSRYGDSLERVLYNTILGAKPTERDGHTFYYSDYNAAASKFYRGEMWPCCSGTFIQLTADYGISAYATGDNSLCVNLYIPSVATADIAGHRVTLTQATAYPLADTSTLRLSLAGPARFALSLRIPAWAGPHTRVTVNGHVQAPVMPGTFHALERTWRDGDVITVTFDMPVRLEALNPAHPDVVAVLTGPLVLFPIGGGAATRQDLLAATRTGPHDWCAQTASGDLMLRPFMAIGDETYRLYTEVTA